MENTTAQQPRSDDYRIYARVAVKDIAFLTKVIEAYENLALVTAVSAKDGLVVVHVTPDTRAIVLEILTNLPITIEVL